MVRRRARGFSFVELVIFLVVSAIALVGVLALYQQAVARSSDVIASKQAMEAGYALLEEIQAMPFTYCQVGDPNASTATSAAGCSLAPQGLAPAAGKSRGSLSSPFANVGDYGGYSATRVADINGSPVPGLEAYSVLVTLTPKALAGVPSSSAVLIEIRIAGPYGAQTISGYRLRHSPNALP